MLRARFLFHLEVFEVVSSQLLSDGFRAAQAMPYIQTYRSSDDRKCHSWSLSGTAEVAIEAVVAVGSVLFARKLLPRNEVLLPLPPGYTPVLKANATGRLLLLGS